MGLEIEKEERRNDNKEPVQHVLRFFLRLDLYAQVTCGHEKAKVCWYRMRSFSIPPVSTKFQRKGNWSTTVTDTSTHKEISRMVPDRMTSATVKLGRPSAPVV